MRAIPAALFALTLLGVLPAAAQEEGSRVRVAPAERGSGDRWIVGTLVARGADSLTVLRDDTRETVSFHRRDVRALQVSTGRRSVDAAMGRGSLVGTAVGIGAGALMGVVVHDDRETYLSRNRSVAFGAAAGGLAGVFVGGAVGWLFAGDEWDAVPLTPTVAAGAGGQVGVALSFRL